MCYDCQTASQTVGKTEELTMWTTGSCLGEKTGDHEASVSVCSAPRTATKLIVLQSLCLNIECQSMFADIQCNRLFLVKRTVVYFFLRLE